MPIPAPPPAPWARISPTSSASMTCPAMSGNGWLTGMERNTTRIAPRTTPKDPLPAHRESCGVAVGSAHRRTSAQRSGAGVSRTSGGTTTTGSALPFPVGDFLSSGLLVSRGGVGAQDPLLTIFQHHETIAIQTCSAFRGDSLPFFLAVATSPIVPASAICPGTVEEWVAGSGQRHLENSHIHIHHCNSDRRVRHLP